VKTSTFSTSIDPGPAMARLSISLPLSIRELLDVNPSSSRGVPTTSASASVTPGAEVMSRLPSASMLALTPGMSAALIALARSESYPEPPTVTSTPLTERTSVGCRTATGSS
jgi:hypothetical protein